MPLRRGRDPHAPSLGSPWIPAGPEVVRTHALRPGEAGGQAKRECGAPDLRRVPAGGQEELEVGGELVQGWGGTIWGPWGSREALKTAGRAWTIKGEET